LCGFTPGSMALPFATWLAALVHLIFAGNQSPISTLIPAL